MMGSTLSAPPQHVAARFMLVHITECGSSEMFVADSEDGHIVINLGLNIPAGLLPFKTSICRKNQPNI
jgi:hypothetical protein